jgi:hypothetical protein
MTRKHLVGAMISLVVLAALFCFYGGSQAPFGQPPLRGLTAQNVGEFRNAFNAAKAAVRVLLLLSPTWAVCLQGAFGVEDLMREFAAKPLCVFVVWEPVLPADWSSLSTAALRRLPDLRVVQFWDKNRLISHSLGEHDRRSVVWDYIAVYPSGTVWEHNPPSALYHGKPVVQVKDEAHERIARALAGTEASISGHVTRCSWYGR